MRMQADKTIIRQIKVTKSSSPSAPRQPRPFFDRQYNRKPTITREIDSQQLNHNLCIISLHLLEVKPKIPQPTLSAMTPYCSSCHKSTMSIFASYPRFYSWYLIEMTFQRCHATTRSRLLLSKSASLEPTARLLIRLGGSAKLGR
jgi:hypothetical protein